MNHFLALIAKADSEGLQACLSNVSDKSKSVPIPSRLVLIPVLILVFSTSF